MHKIVGYGLLTACALVVSGTANSQEQNVCSVHGGNVAKVDMEIMKHCQPGDRLLMQFTTETSPTFMISRYCDLRYTVVRDTHKTAEFVTCIYWPSERR